MCCNLCRLLVALNAEMQKATAAKGTHALDPYFDLTNITLWPMFKKVRASSSKLKLPHLKGCPVHEPMCLLCLDRTYNSSLSV